MSERILELALAATGGGETDRTLLEPLCAAAEEAWRRRLREDVTEEDCGEALLCAAAFTAAADLAAGRGGGAVAAFTAGDISVRGRGAAESASLSRDLRQTAEGLMAPYAAEADFCFRGVRG